MRWIRRLKVHTLIVSCLAQYTLRAKLHHTRFVTRRLFIRNQTPRCVCSALINILVTLYFCTE